MSQLTADAVQVFETPGIDNEFGVLDNVVIYRGSAVGSSGGYARQLVAGDLFLGFAEMKVDNTVTGHASGFKTIPVRRAGYVQLAISAAAVTDIGKAVYASDGNTYTFTATSNSRVGTVARFISTGVVIVRFDSVRQQSLGSITAVTFGTNIAAKTAASLLTDSSATNPTDSQFNQLAKDLGAKINEILAAGA